jgi:tetraprenyl-beta-curcumene synthase
VAVSLPLARREIARWTRRAEAIADPPLRELALDTLRRERRNSEGAAAFAVLHPLGAWRLVPLLVAYQLAWDLVDTLLEHPAEEAGEREAVRAVLELALEPGAAGERTVGGLLGELVEACRAGCEALPRFDQARPALRRLAARTDAMLVTNVPVVRPRALGIWAARDQAAGDGLEPAELCAAAQCSLAIHALLATAAARRGRPRDFEAVESAYYPWIDAVCTLLDSVVDRDEDERTGDFSFVSQYPSSAHAARRLAEISRRALEGTAALPAPRRHAALTCALVGMYVAAPSAESPRARQSVEAVLAATGPLTRWARAVAVAQRRVG